MLVVKKWREETYRSTSATPGRGVGGKGQVEQERMKENMLSAKQPLLHLLCICTPAYKHRSPTAWRMLSKGAGRSNELLMSSVLLPLLFPPFCPSFPLTSTALHLPPFPSLAPAPPLKSTTALSFG